MRAGLEHLDRERLRVAALHLRHPRADEVAGKPAADEDDEAVQPRDAVPAVGERVDPELELVVVRRGGHRLRVALADGPEAQSQDVAAHEPHRRSRLAASGLADGVREDESGGRRPCGRAARRTRRRRSPARCRARACRRRAGPSPAGSSATRGRATARSGRPGPRCAASAQSSSTICSSAVLEVARDERVGVLVDRHAGGRVRDVDECRARPVDAVERLLHLAVMSTSCVRRSVRRAISCTRGILRPCRARAVTERELDGIRERADRFIAELDEEYYLHYAGLKDDARPGADLRRARRPDDGRARRRRWARPWTATAASASSGASPARATSGNLTREHAETRRRARGRARGDRRRRDDPLPDAPRRRSRTSRDRASAREARADPRTS